MSRPPSPANADAFLNEALHSARHARPILLCAVGVLCAVMLLDLLTGEASVQAHLPVGTVLRTLAHHLPFVGRHILLKEPYYDGIVWENRLPRVMVAALIGMLLALSGVAFQSLLQNPLADPYTVGVASGSALGSVAIYMLRGVAWLGGMAQPFAAFSGGLAAVNVVYLLARVRGRVSAQTFLLAGTMVGTFFWSLVPLIITLANRSGDNLRDKILSTLFGSLTLMDWDRVALLLPFGVVGGLTLWLCREELDMMAVGEESAIHLGLDFERFMRRVILAGTLMTAAAVSVGGIIAFVGFVVPHIARRMVGSRHKFLLPGAMLFGGILLVLADWISRVILNGIEVGVVTSLLGAPVFCVMLRRRLVNGE